MSTQFTNRQWRLPNEENKSKVSNYSMSFDGSSQYVSISNSTAYSSYSVSCWINADTLTNFTRLVSLDSVNHRFLGLHGDGTLISGYNSGGWSEFFTTSTITTGTWNHIVLVDNGTNTKIYVNTVENTLSNSIAVDGPNYYIGTYNGSGNFFDGKIDAVAVFDYALSSSQVTTLYGSSSTGIGNPITLNPVAYYPLGDQDAFNGANYLVPNIAAEEDDGDIATSFSPYALDFDGTNDYIDCGDSDDFSFGDGTNDSPFSYSTWVNMDDATSFVLFSKYPDDNAHTKREYRIFISNADKPFLLLYDAETTSSINYRVATNAITSYQNQWINLTFTYDGRGGNLAGDGIKIYLNGSSIALDATISSSYVSMHNTSTPARIGRTLTSYANGKMSNCSLWSTELTSSQVTEIYNEGLPGNLNSHSAYSNLISWWQLGSNSSFNTNWTVLDEKGSNNGTSVNMTEADIVDGVGSYANGVSSGMSDNIVGDAFGSSANSLSYNMDVLDRTEDTPS